MTATDLHARDDEGRRAVDRAASTGGPEVEAYAQLLREPGG